MDKRRVVITGIGAVTPVGNDARSTWAAVQEGKCGVAPISRFDASGMKASLAAEVKGFEPETAINKRDLRHLDLFAQYAIAAAVEAMADAGLGKDPADAVRCGVDVSSGIGGLNSTETEHSKGLERGFDKISPYYIPMTISNIAAAQIAIRFGLKGMCACPVAACSGSGNAVGDAFRYIRDGYAEVMVCGGSEAAVTPMGIGGFTSMKALCLSSDPARASIPFDKERCGFVLGEGAAILVLEELEHAKARGAGVYAEMVGYGVTCDAYHVTAPAPDGSGGARAMAEALADGGISPEQVDYINAHGTSTPLNDAGECRSIKTVFGTRAKDLMVSSTKSMTGHMLGAAGAVEVLLAALSLRDGFVPATIGYKVPDEECDLDVVPNQGRKADIHYALSNSLGFGGHNTALLLKKWEG